MVEIERLRRQRLSSPAIAGHLGIPVSTVTSVLRRLGLNRLKTLEPPAPVIRYERERPGELLHLDTKKLGRIDGIGHRITGRRTGAINRHHGIGWEHLHVCIDDASRLACTEILADERKATAIAASAGKRSTLPSTPPAWPIPSCFPTRKKRAPFLSSAARSAGSPVTASPSSGS